MFLSRSPSLSPTTPSVCIYIHIYIFISISTHLICQREPLVAGPRAVGQVEDENVPANGLGELGVFGVVVGGAEAKAERGWRHE